MTLLRSLLFVIWLYGGMAVLGLMALPALLLPRRFIVGLIRLYAHLVIAGLRIVCGIQVELRGREHVGQGPQLIAGKHQAMLDVFIPFLYFDDPVVIMKRELLWYPFLGWYALKSRQIPIDRGGGAQTMRKMLKAAQSRVPEGRGRQLTIYPEGTRTAPGAPPAYKPAGLRAFYKALNLPVLPMATNSGLCWPARGLRRRPGKIVYELLPPVPAGLANKDMLVRLQDRLENASDALLEEGRQAQRDRS
ncbi:MAG: lysophospholipid acyltransferase family protein [Henriciella sp.]|jgi:1-acyl-sn-glycerol-3-phosphate acyltransferase